MFKAITILSTFLLLCAAQGWAEEPIKVIVFPLNEFGQNVDLAWLGEGISTSLAKQLKSRRVRVMESDKRIELTESLDLPSGGPLSRGSMIRVAQEASADLAIMGNCEGSEKKLRISVRALDLKSLKLSGEMSANGSLSALPQMENELAWLILTNTGIERSLPREKFQERTRKIPNAAYALYIQSLSASGENGKLRLLLKAVDAYHDFPEAQLRLGDLYFHRGDCGSAIKHLDLQSSDPDISLESTLIRGNCFLQRNQPSEAIRDYLQVLKGSRSFEVLNNLGVAYLREGDNKQALNALMDAKTMGRNDATVLSNLAIVQHLQGNGLAARSTLQDALKSNPENGMLQFLLGFFLKNQGENETAALTLSKAKSVGVNVEKLLAENPESWLRVFANWTPPGNF